MKRSSLADASSLLSWLKLNVRTGQLERIGGENQINADSHLGTRKSGLNIEIAYRNSHISGVQILNKQLPNSLTPIWRRSVRTPAQTRPRDCRLRLHCQSQSTWTYNISLHSRPCTQDLSWKLSQNQNLACESLYSASLLIHPTTNSWPFCCAKALLHLSKQN